MICGRRFLLALLLVLCSLPGYTLEYDHQTKKELLILNEELRLQTEILLESLATQSFSIDAWQELSESFEERLRGLLEKVQSLEGSDEELQRIISELKKQQYAYEALLKDSMRQLKACQTEKAIWRAGALSSGGANLILIAILILL